MGNSSPDISQPAPSIISANGFAPSRSQRTAPDLTNGRFKAPRLVAHRPTWQQIEFNGAFDEMPSADTVERLLADIKANARLTSSTSRQEAKTVLPPATRTSRPPEPSTGTPQPVGEDTPEGPEVIVDDPLPAQLQQEFNLLRNKLLHAARQENLKVIMLCGVEAAAGAEFIGLHLGQELASLAHLNVARLSLSHEQAVPPAPTLQICQYYPHDTPLCEITLPHRALTPADLQEEPKVQALLRHLRMMFDFVLIDAPPPTTDNRTSCLAEHVDAVLLMARQHRTSLAQIALTQKMLQTHQARVLGLVFNENRL